MPTLMRSKPTNLRFKLRSETTCLLAMPTGHQVSSIPGDIKLPDVVSLGTYVAVQILRRNMSFGSEVSLV